MGLFWALFRLILPEKRGYEINGKCNFDMERCFAKHMMFQVKLKMNDDESRDKLDK